MTRKKNHNKVPSLVSYSLKNHKAGNVHQWKQYRRGFEPSNIRGSAKKISKTNPRLKNEYSKGKGKGRRPRKESATARISPVSNKVHKNSNERISNKKPSQDKTLQVNLVNRKN